MRHTACLVSVTLAAALTAAAANDESKRMERAANTLTAITTEDIGDGQLAHADCIAVIPGFKKVAAVVGVGHGRGFISCRNGSSWSAPGAIALDSGNLGVEIGGEEMDLVIVSLDPSKRSKLLSDRFVIGTDASAAWGNGKSAHEDPNAQIRFYGRTKGVFAGFGLDGVTLKPDASGDHALYGKSLSNSEIVSGGTETPEVSQVFMAALTQASGR